MEEEVERHGIAMRSEAHWVGVRSTTYTLLSLLGLLDFIGGKLLGFKTYTD